MTKRALLLAAVLITLPVRGVDLIRADGTIDFARYHNSAEAAQILRELEARYPGLAKVHTIGKSLRGQDLLVLELTNRKVRSPEETPGYYIDGGVHACELTGSEQVLYLAWYYATRYGKDEAVTRLLDGRTLYLRPKFNPDGSDYCLTHPDSLRSTVRPWDDDEDGRKDEDAPEDLDADGAITTMRVPSVNGTHQISTDDPRLMVERKSSETGGTYYLLLSEGVDSDGDGRFNEDGVGGIDMNRNFPRTWGLPYQQTGAGPYPLSEPETRATIEFLDAHRNITGIVHNHTAGGFLYRLPSTNPPSDHEANDLELVKLFGDKYTEVTGHPVHDSYSGEGTSRHGTLISWGYFDYGVIGWVPEHWGGFGKDYDGDKRVSDKERLRWNDEELGGAGFTPWKEYAHPQLGKVEIGGWKRKYTQQNPPGKFLEAEIALKVPWFSYIVSTSPRLSISSASATPLGGGLHRIDVTIENDGLLPTNVTERALKARLARPVYAQLTSKTAEIVSGQAREDLGHIPGTRALRGAGFFGGGEPRANRRSVSWVVKTSARDASVEVTVQSEKGGTERKTLALRY